MQIDAGVSVVVLLIVKRCNRAGIAQNGCFFGLYARGQAQVPLAALGGDRGISGTAGGPAVADADCSW